MKPIPFDGSEEQISLLKSLGFSYDSQELDFLDEETGNPARIYTWFSTLNKTEFRDGDDTFSLRDMWESLWDHHQAKICNPVLEQLSGGDVDGWLKSRGFYTYDCDFGYIKMGLGDPHGEELRIIIKCPEIEGGLYNLCVIDKSYVVIHRYCDTRFDVADEINRVLSLHKI